MKTFYIPSFSGDFRLEKQREFTSLTVENPTPSECGYLADFLRKANEKDWTRMDSVPLGESSIILHCG